MEREDTKELADSTRKTVSDETTGVKTTRTVFEIISVLDKQEGATAQGIAETIDASQSSVYAHLSTLQDLDYLVKNGNEYQLGLRFLEHGAQARRHIDLADIVQPRLDSLAEETGEIVWFVVEQHGQGVYMRKSLGQAAVQPYGRIGKRVDLHDIAAGKAILSELSTRRVYQIVQEHGLTKHTENTITDFDDLREELKTIRERGYALNETENLQGFRAVASPVVPENELKGAVVVSGPKARLRDDRFEREIPEIVSRKSNELEMDFLSQNNR